MDSDCILAAMDLGSATVCVKEISRCIIVGLGFVAWVPVLAEGPPPLLPVVRAADPFVARSDAPGQRFPLGLRFGMEPIDTEVVRFTSQFDSPPGVRLEFDIALFTEATPLHRTNFLNYVNAGFYNDSLVHRSDPGFVWQGGSFRLTEDGLESVPTFPPVMNEFGISNTQFTVSLAKLGGGNPNSGTAGWFVNASDNSANLDFQNGGFTVFGRVTRTTQFNFQILSTTSNFPVFDKSAQFGSAFSQMPLHIGHNPANAVTGPEMMLFPTVARVPLPAGVAGTSPALDFSIQFNNRPDLVSASLDGGDLVITPVSPGAAGFVRIWIGATDNVGNSVIGEVRVRVLEAFSSWRSRVYSAADAADDAISGPTARGPGGLTNIERFVLGVLPIENPGPHPVRHSTVGGKARFVFPLGPNTTGFNVRVEKSGNLDGWTTVPFSLIERIPVNGRDRVTIEVDEAVQAPGFYRVAFELLGPG